MSESDNLVSRIMKLSPEERRKFDAFTHRLSLHVNVIEAKRKYKKHMRELREYEGETRLDIPPGVTDNQTNG